VDLSGLSELRYIRGDRDKIHIGALTTIADLRKQTDPPAWGRLLDDVTAKFGSPNIRNAATVGGNICAASSSEDLIPVFLALDANVKAIRRGGVREMALKDFIVSKRRTALHPGEILAEVSFSKLSPRSACSFQKLGIRNTLIIALVSVAAVLETDETGSSIKSARIALNRLKRKIPERSESLEKELLGQKLNEQTIRKAAEVLGDELALTSDFRASAQYRCEAAKVLFRRALTECQVGIAKK